MTSFTIIYGKETGLLNIKKKSKMKKKTIFGLFIVLFAAMAVNKIKAQCPLDTAVDFTVVTLDGDTFHLIIPLLRVLAFLTVIVAVFVGSNT